MVIGPLGTPPLLLKGLLDLGHPYLAKRKHFVCVAPWLLHANWYLRPQIPTRGWVVKRADGLSGFFVSDRFNERVNKLS